MGDLLVAAAKRLPLEKRLSSTLRQWGKQLAGTDLHQEFINGTRTRLVLLARQRHKSNELLKVSHAQLFPNIRVANGLKQHALFQRATHLLLNPPFGLVATSKSCRWAGGRITAAAEFMVTALERTKPGTQILAILPDVLRSGSFTEHWRTRICELSEILRIEPHGIFDSTADVDVFLLRLKRCLKTKTSKTFAWPTKRAKAKKTIGDFFNVHVGRVVPHRDKKEGPKHPYIHARCVPLWTIMRDFPEMRRHKGRVYDPPFLVIRRTSRPGHPYRAAATVIAGKNPVAVENHLIVCEPKDRKQSTARKLMQQLKSTKVNNYLNDRIRCRHLTIGSVKDIPFSN